METIVHFSNKGSRMYGILHEPESAWPGPRKRLGVVLLHAGRQARRGPHKLYVKVARALCRQGFPVLRYDNRGYGDSEGSEEMTLHDWYADACSAISYFTRTSELDGLMLWGLCGGSVLAVHYAAEHPRLVDSMLLCNLVYQSDHVNLKGQFTSTYRKLASPAFWYKALKTSPLFYFKKSVPHFQRFFRKAFSPTQAETSFETSAVHFVRTLPRAFKRITVPVSFIFSDLDPYVGNVREEFINNPLWNKSLSRAQTRFEIIEEADHNFSSTDLEALVLEKCAAWAKQRARSGEGAPGGD